MRWIYGSLALAFLCVGLVACSSPVHPTEVFADQSDLALGVTVSPASFSVTSVFQAIQGEVLAPTGVKWQISTETPWIAVVKEGDVGSAPFVATVDANLCGGAPRRGYLRVDPGAVRVTIEQDSSDLGVCQ